MYIQTNLVRMTWGKWSDLVFLALRASDQNLPWQQAFKRPLQKTLSQLWLFSTSQLSVPLLACSFLRPSGVNFLFLESGGLVCNFPCTQLGKSLFPQTTIYFVNFVSHLLFGKLWTGVNLYSSCILIVAKLYRFLYFGWEIFLLSIINCFLSWHFNQSLVMITEVQLQNIFLRGLRFVSCANVPCTLVTHTKKTTPGEEWKWRVFV